MTRKRTKRSRSASRRRACFHKNNDQTRTSKQNPEQGQKASGEQNQQLQWILEQAQLRYNELQDKSSKQVNLTERLLGFCAISGFTSFLSQSTWDYLSRWGAESILKCSIGVLFGVVIAAVVALLIRSLCSYFDDRDFLDITKLDQDQSWDKKTYSLIKNLRTLIKTLRTRNAWYTLVLGFLYVAYAVSLELLVLAILLYH